jgi:hypothetical protein
MAIRCAGATLDARIMGSGRNSPAARWNPMQCFRELYEEAVQYEGENLYTDVLEPRLDAARGLIAPLRHARTLRAAAPMNLPDEPPRQIYENGAEASFVAYRLLG